MFFAHDSRAAHVSIQHAVPVEEHGPRPRHRVCLLEAAIGISSIGAVSGRSKATVVLVVARRHASVLLPLGTPLRRIK